MKARLLVGLLTVALGGLTSCSNILEENGVINNVAESGMGELRINLSTDASLNVSTKAEQANVTTVTDNTSNVTINGQSITFDLNALIIKATGTETYEASFKEFPDYVKKGDYNVTATYNKMNDKDLAWDAPSFYGTTTESVSVTTTEPGNASINAKLENSIITINKPKFDNFKTEVSIKKLFVYAGSKESVPTENEGITTFSLIDNTDSEVALRTDRLLFVKENVSNIHIHLEYTLQGETKEYTKLITTNTAKSKNYCIAYELVKESGKLALIITVDGNVTTEPISVPVNPYKPDTNTQES